MNNSVFDKIITNYKIPRDIDLSESFAARQASNKIRNAVIEATKRAEIMRQIVNYFGRLTHWNDMNFCQRFAYGLHREKK